MPLGREVLRSLGTSVCLQAHAYEGEVGWWHRGTGTGNGKGEKTTGAGDGRFARFSLQLSVSQRLRPVLVHSGHTCV